VRIAARVPLLVVDAVQDPRDVAGARAHDAVEAERVLGTLDLERIRRRDGVDELRENGAALQVAHPAVVLKRVGAAEIPGQAEHSDRVHPELALVGDVVDREHARGPVERRVVPVEGLQVHGHEPRLPVVGVEDARPLAPAPEVLERGAREEGEAQPVVGVVAVDRVAVVERRVLDEYDVDARRGARPVEARAARHAVDRHVDGARELAGRKRDAAEARQHDRDPVSEPAERLRQRGGDVRQPSRLDVRHHLGRDERDVQPILRVDLGQARTG
jgi:hypothetical protein